jgi:alanine dehydrogenase
MPGAFPQSSTVALINASLRYVNAVATKGWKEALAEDAGLAQGLNTDGGVLTNEAVGLAHGLSAVNPSTRLS